MRLFIALTLPQAVRDDRDRLATALPGLRMPQFELSLAGIGGFGKGRQPRSLWAGVDLDASPPLSWTP